MESHWFDKKISVVAKQLKCEIKYSGIRGDNYDNAKKYLLQQQLTTLELEKLQLQMVLKEQKAKHNLQIAILIATLFISIITALLGAMYGAFIGSTLGGIFTVSFSDGTEELKKQMLKEINELIKYSANQVKWQVVFIILFGTVYFWIMGKNYYNSVRESILFQTLINDVKEQQERK